MTNNRLYTDFIVSSERSLTKKTATSEIIIKNSKSWGGEEPNFQSCYIIIFKKCNLNKNAQEQKRKYGPYIEKNKSIGTVSEKDQALNF